jgi:two-component system NtrC family sensor kinase
MKTGNPQGRLEAEGLADTILIVDDSLTVRMDLKEAFEDAGFQTILCASAAAARQAFADAAVCVAVLDVLLPDGNGVDLLMELRASADTSGIVVLMLSTEAEVTDRLHGLRTGADEYIGKPYDIHYVVARARELLRARRAEPETAGPSTILVIDDSVTFREALAEALEGAGYIVQVGASGEEGLRIAAAGRPRAVIVDSVLPGIDGSTVIRRLRLDTVLRSVPCLLLTGSEDNHMELRALEAGADAFLRKDEDAEVILARLAALLRSASSSVGEKTASLLGPKRILAVDDSATYLADVAAMLREEGYDVVSARSGDEALELLAAQSVDCILLDLLMPGLSGRETCRRIKAVPIIRNIPLIIVTAVEDRTALFDALEAGADDYLQKSAEFDVLKARVRAQLRRKQFEDDNRRIRLDQYQMEIEATEARAARVLANSRAELLLMVEQKNQALQAANVKLESRQLEIAQTNRELASANQAKTEFLATMSHELRTPLVAILGFSELLVNGKAGELTPRQREYVGYMGDSGTHLLALINDLLDVSKIEAGKVELDLESIDLDDLLTQTVAIVRERALARGISLEVSGSGRSEPLLVDRRRLKQIVYNLLSNAVKFASDGGHVSMRAGFVDRRQASTGLPGFETGVRTPLPPGELQGFAEISVCDSGIGISAEDMARLFTPFTQIKSTLARTSEGTGLGLVIVSRLVELHGGAVAVTSAPGTGSCFSIWLPWRSQQLST